MTVIAVSKKHRRIASDRLAVRHAIAFESQKIYHGTSEKGANIVFGFSGNTSDIPRIKHWVFADDTDPEKFPLSPDADFALIVVWVSTLSEEVKIDFFDRSAYAMPIMEDFFAIGAGNDAAMACMSLGHTPEEAVQAYCNISVLAGKGIDVLDF